MFQSAIGIRPTSHLIEADAGSKNIGLAAPIILLKNLWWKVLRADYLESGTGTSLDQVLNALLVNPQQENLLVTFVEYDIFRPYVAVGQTFVVHILKRMQ